MFLTAAENDHSITVFNANEPTSIGSLRTESEVLSLDFYSRLGQLDRTEMGLDLSDRLTRPQEALIAVDKDGVLEIFPEPFDFGSSSLREKSDSLKARMKRRTRKAVARVRITRPDKSSATIPLINASFQGNELTLAWAEGGVQVLFEKIKWRDEGTGNLLLKDDTAIVKAKSGAVLGAAIMNGVKDMGKSHVDESHTVVVNGGDADDVPMVDEDPEVISISSGEEESVFEEDGPAKSNGIEEVVGQAVEQANMDDVEMEGMHSGVDNIAEDQEEPDEPSFGDLIRANAPEAVDVQAALTDPNAQSLVPTSERVLQQLPSGMSLGTVLTQSLRTNDTNLLETCFHVKDLSTVRTTIERLESSFATILLQRLAERLHSRPGRAGSLMVWIQWTLVVHGGYLAGQPEVMKKLASLHRVVKDRANSLQPLLSLKGKLDMLEAQMNLRKSMQARSRTANALEDEEEEGVVYVEGQEDSDSEDDDVDDSPPKKAIAKPSAETDASDSGADGEEDDENEDYTPVIRNGMTAESEGSDSEEGGLLDEEASSTDNDSVDELSEEDIDHDSVDSIESSDAEAPPPPKRAVNSKLSNAAA
ncbi:U3 small nucleolar RNA-associated protein 5, partial [Lecanoromycetidae sp. Uapishka_2]